MKEVVGRLVVVGASDFEALLEVVQVLGLLNVLSLRLRAEKLLRVVHVNKVTGQLLSGLGLLDELEQVAGRLLVHQHIDTFEGGKGCVVSEPMNHA